MQEKYPGCSRKCFLKFVWCVAAEQNNNNKVSSDSSHFYWSLLQESIFSFFFFTVNHIANQGMVAQSMVSANHWLRSIKARQYMFLWKLTLVNPKP